MALDKKNILELLSMKKLDSSIDINQILDSHLKNHPDDYFSFLNMSILTKKLKNIQHLFSLPFPATDNYGNNVFHSLAKTKELDQCFFSKIVTLLKNKDANINIEHLISSPNVTGKTPFSLSLPDNSFMIDYIATNNIKLSHENVNFIQQGFCKAVQYLATNNQNVETFMNNLDIISSNLTLNDNGNNKKNSHVFLNKINHLSIINIIFKHQYKGLSFYKNLIQAEPDHEVKKEHFKNLFNYGCGIKTKYTLTHMNKIFNAFKKIPEFPVFDFFSFSVYQNSDVFCDFITKPINKQIINNNIHEFSDFFIEQFIQRTRDDRLGITYDLLSIINDNNKDLLSQSNDNNLFQKFTHKNDDFPVMMLLLSMGFKYANIIKKDNIQPEFNIIEHYLNNPETLCIPEQILPNNLTYLFDKVIKNNKVIYILKPETINNIEEFPSETLGLIYFHQKEDKRSTKKHALDLLMRKNLLYKGILDNDINLIETELNKVLHAPSQIKCSYLDNDMATSYYSNYLDVLKDFNNMLERDYSVKISDDVYMKLSSVCYNKEIKEGIQYISPAKLAEFEQYSINYIVDKHKVKTSKIKRL